MSNEWLLYLAALIILKNHQKWQTVKSSITQYAAFMKRLLQKHTQCSHISERQCKTLPGLKRLTPADAYI